MVDEKPKGGMNPEVKEKWVAALRSGEYKQGKYNLCFSIGEGDKHCCLGVLADLAHKEGVLSDDDISVQEHTPEYAPSQTTRAVTYDGEQSFLPEKVMRWAGLEKHGADVEIPSLEHPTLPYSEDIGPTLSMLNDNYGYTFEDIAQVIERHL